MSIVYINVECEDAAALQSYQEMQHCCKHCLLSAHELKSFKCAPSTLNIVIHIIQA